MSEIRVGILGLGFIGQTHLRAYESARQAGYDVRVAAVCDQDPSRLSGVAHATGNFEDNAQEQLFDPTKVVTSTDPEELFNSNDLDLISVCTHTGSHIQYATRSLESGKHVLVEKPVATNAKDIASLCEILEPFTDLGLLCMPAMCMRFWPAWAWLIDTIRANTYGPVRSASFQRLGSMPNWSTGFYSDNAASGGALLDLHIHDTDFVHACFGAPVAVHSSGDVNHVTTSYLYDGAPIHVTAEGCWDRSPKAPFEMRYTVCFRDATAVFNLNADEQLIVHSESASTPVPMPSHNGWEMQTRALLDAISSNRKSPPVTMPDALDVMRTIEAEKRSLEERSVIALDS